MDWTYWNGRKVFLQLRTGAVYTGKVIEVDGYSPALIFLTIIDKFGARITVACTEIIKIKEEGGDEVRQMS